MAKYRKKPVEVEAVQWTGENDDEISIFAGGKVLFMWFAKRRVLLVETIDGATRAHVGDWIIKGLNDEIYPCKPDIFEKTYERVEE